MEHLSLRLDAEQARFLNERASRLRSTPDALISSMLTALARLAAEADELGPDETVEDRMAAIAEHYASDGRDPLEDDPDLCLDVAGTLSLTGDMPRKQPRRSADNTEPPAEMSNAEIEQAFGEIADHYEEIISEVFGDKPPLSVGALPGPRMVA